MSLYVVVVDMVVRPDEESDLAGKFSGPFMAAITAQPGFKSVELLRPTDGHSHLLVIRFTDRSLQQTWLASELHTEVWSPIEAHLRHYSVRTFHTV